MKYNTNQPDEMEVAARLRQLPSIVAARECVEFIAKKAKSPQMHLVIKRVTDLIADFEVSIGENLLNSAFSSSRIHCLACILEQTVISMLIECNLMNQKRKNQFSRIALEYLEQSQRNQLLKFWHKQNNPKKAIRSVMDEWTPYTITDMLNAV